MALANSTIDTLRKNPDYERGHTEPGLVAFYDIRPANGAGLFFQPGARTGHLNDQDQLLTTTDFLSGGVGLIEQRLGPHLSSVDLSEVGRLALLVLGMVLVALFAPQPVVVLLRVAPLVELCAQTPQHQRHRHARLLHQTLDHVRSLVAVDPSRHRKSREHQVQNSNLNWS